MNDKTVSIAANAIGWIFYSTDGRPITKNENGIDTIVTSDIETELCLRAAEKVLEHLEK